MDDEIIYTQHIIKHCQDRATGYILMLDQEKAFDRVDRNYMYKTLQAFGFPENYIKMVRTAYNSTPTNIKINNVVGKEMELSCGVRQGCPLSPLLYALTLEPLNKSIRQNKAFQGIKSTNNSFPTAKEKSFADDKIVFCKDTQDVQIVLSLCEPYGQASGGKINISKTEILPIGPTDQEEETLISTLGVKILSRDQLVRLLGTPIGNSLKPKDIWNPIINRVISALQSRMTKRLTIRGRVLLIQTKIIPLITFRTKFHDIDQERLEYLEKLIYHFIWGYKKALVQKDIAHLPLKNGGINLPKPESPRDDTTHRLDQETARSNATNLARTSRGRNQRTIPVHRDWYRHSGKPQKPTIKNNLWYSKLNTWTKLKGRAITNRQFTQEKLKKAPASLLLPQQKNETMLRKGYKRIQDIMDDDTSDPFHPNYKPFKKLKKPQAHLA